MKPQSRFVASLLLAATLTGASGVANSSYASSFQQGPGRGPITAPRDPETEKQSFKSLDAAKFYFYKRKPDKNDKAALERSNKAVLDRLQEIIDTNKDFARIDEVYFLMGEVHKRAGDTDKAIEFWTKAIKETSDEKLKSEAQKHMDETQAQTKSKKG